MLGAAAKVRYRGPEAVVLDFVNREVSAAFSFSALRFLVSVSSARNGCSCVLKGLFSKPQDGLILAFANPIFLFYRPLRYQGPIAQHVSRRSSALEEKTAQSRWATQGSFVGQSTEMHDLRQRHCLIGTPTSLKPSGYRVVLLR
jgi:hypothetical protein